MRNHEKAACECMSYADDADDCRRCSNPPQARACAHAHMGRLKPRLQSSASSAVVAIRREAAPSGAWNQARKTQQTQHPSLSCLMACPLASAGLALAIRPETTAAEGPRHVCCTCGCAGCEGNRSSPASHSSPRGS